MRLTLIAAAAGIISMAALPAAAGAPIYMTDTGNPWGSTSSQAAMNSVFGAGGWSEQDGYDASVFSSGASFIFINGGDGDSTDFNTFVEANQTAIQNYVNGGGHLLVIAGQWDFSADPLLIANGLDIGTAADAANPYSSASYVGALTASGLAAGLSANGAGASWTGDYFSHEIVTGGDCLISGSAGCTLTESGNVLVSGETDPEFMSGGGQQLWVNQIQATIAGVPEPASWSLMLLGVGFGGAMLRRRRSASPNCA